MGTTLKSISWNRYLYSFSAQFLEDFGLCPALRAQRSEILFYALKGLLFLLGKGKGGRRWKFLSLGTLMRVLLLILLLDGDRDSHMCFICITIQRKVQSSFILFCFIRDRIHLLRREPFPHGYLQILLWNLSKRCLVHDFLTVQLALAAGIVNTAHIA